MEIAMSGDGFVRRTARAVGTTAMKVGHAMGICSSPEATEQTLQERLASQRDAIVSGNWDRGTIGDQDNFLENAAKMRAEEIQRWQERISLGETTTIWPNGIGMTVTETNFSQHPLEAPQDSKSVQNKPPPKAKYGSKLGQKAL